MDTHRRSEDVLNLLLHSMTATVTSYHPTVKRTNCTIGGLIQGTACFPGGSGTWRGEANGGLLPAYFPASPVMFVAHNFDSERGYALSVSRKGEATGEFWQRLLKLISGAGISPDECFFSNALMGLKPGRAEGEMPSISGYREQRALFLKRQVEIVKPRAVIALGVKAERYVSGLSVPTFAVRHPKDWYFRELLSQRDRLLAEGRSIQTFLDQHQGGATPLRQAQNQHDTSDTRLSILEAPYSISPKEISTRRFDGTDEWGFRTGTRNSFLMNAVEVGGKSKEKIRSEFLQRFPDSAGKSTFNVFFTDVIRQFGCASVSRGICIETDSREHMTLDSTRVLVVKAAIRQGLLAEIGSVEKNIYPKKDRHTIEQILRRCGVPLK